MVVSVGIDVSKDKHDCFIVSSEGEVLADVFTIPNTMDGFHCLLQRIRDCPAPQDKIKVGLARKGLCLWPWPESNQRHFRTKGATLCRCSAN